MVVADGPRADHPDDAEKCAAARAVVERVDWDCEVLTNFSDTNMGCRRRVSSGLDWVFGRGKEAIILEDDCLPHATFFRFCEELLDRFRDDERVMAISGDSFQFGESRSEHSYYYSRYPHCWGWASWRRAWRHYDEEMELWPLIRDGDWLRDILGDRRAVKYWTRILDRSYVGHFDTWDYGWTLACWVQSGLTILPTVNLVSNIGFGAQATHTKVKGRLAEVPTYPMVFPLRHPPLVIRDAQADRFTQAHRYDRVSVLVKLLSRMKRKAEALLRGHGLG
jgi:hypothetical protein